MIQKDEAEFLTILELSFEVISSFDKFVSCDMMKRELC